MPEPSDRRLFPVAPGKMAILAVKLLGDDFERAKHTNEGRSHKFSSHLWIFDIRRAALWTVDHYFRIRQRARHEANLLQGRLIVNIGA